MTNLFILGLSRPSKNDLICHLYLTIGLVLHYLLLLSLVNRRLNVGARLLSRVITTRIMMRHGTVISVLSVVTTTASISTRNKCWVHHESLIEGLISRRRALIKGALFAHRLEHRIIDKA